ncbi:hypothetical protein I3843_03G146300 [Carya illinoinensis]|nr:hypothetical protein I3760_03G144900 [Carya illinoinensis]KAG7987679.1 hypothetical protein I3843_03G146300 [Carya illinoinensis]
MDFEPLWALGGWLIFPNNCMAVPKTSSSIPEIQAKSQPFVLFLAILFIFFLLVNLSNSMNPSMTAASSSSVPVKIRLLLEYPSSASAKSTTNLHPKQTRNRHTSSPSSSTTKREFGAEAHEVPSGPNPISN